MYEDRKQPANMTNESDLLAMQATRASLRDELQVIWDETGESDADRDKLLLEAEQECLEVYRRKVDLACKGRSRLRQIISDTEAELAAVCSAMAEQPSRSREIDQNNAVCLKKKLQISCAQLEEMTKRREERKKKFSEVLDEIRNVSEEINGTPSCIYLDESDLSLMRLEEWFRRLHTLEKEKSDHMKLIHKHTDTLKLLCSVLGVDFKQAFNEIQPSFGDAHAPIDISRSSIQLLAAAIHRLRNVKIQRMQMLQDLVTSMLELWTLLDTPVEEQQVFQSVTCNIAALEHEINEPNTLSMDFINHVKAEVSRLEALKSSKMVELVLRKRSELKEICRKAHLVPEMDSSIECAVESRESGTVLGKNVDPAGILEQIELQIANAKEHAFSRKEILEKIEKWLAACEEESWLEEYSKDENRYNTGRGTHLNLKRAEKARSLVAKLPGMVEALSSKIVVWEKEKRMEFLYDGIRFLAMLGEYTMLQQEKEEKKRRRRDQKKIDGQLIAEHEVLYGSKLSTSKPLNGLKGHVFSTGGENERRLSSGGPMPHSPKSIIQHSSKVALHARSTTKANRAHQMNPASQCHDDDDAAVDHPGISET